MNIKQFTIIGLALAAICCSCSPKQKDPLKENIVAKVLEVNPGIESFAITKLEKERDVTLGEELQRREQLFKTKSKVFKKKLEQYKDKNMPVNAEKNSVQHKSAEETLERLDNYRETHAEEMENVIYSIYVFDGYGRNKNNQRVEVRGFRATAAPDGTVYNIYRPNENPTQHMGVAITGYLEEIVKGER